MIQKQRLVITGGHLTPALALIEEIQRSDPNWQIFYFGRKYALEGVKETSFEFRTVSQLKGVRFIPLVAGKIQRRWTRYSLIHLLKIPIGFFLALFWLIKIRPRLIVAFGGYLSSPVVIAGWLLRIPAISHEQTITIGLANRINLLFVRKMAVSFPNLKRQLKSQKVVWTGNPLRPEIFNRRPRSSSSLWRRINPKRPLLYVTGGKAGSALINQVIRMMIPQLTQKFFVLHQIGLDPSIEPEKRQNYLAVRLVENNDIGWVLNRARLVICRAGANTVLELAALAKPAILIPIPWVSANEQEKNARFLKRLGLGEIIPQNQFNPETLWRTIIKMEQNWDRYRPRRPIPDNRQAARRLWQLAQSVLDHEND